MKIAYHGCGLNNNCQLGPHLQSMSTDIEDASTAFNVNSVCDLHLQLLDLSSCSTTSFQNVIQISLSYIFYKNNSGWETFGHKGNFIENALPAMRQSIMVRPSEKRLAYVTKDNELFVSTSTGTKRVHLQHLAGLNNDNFEGDRKIGLKDVSVQDNCLIIVDEDGSLFSSGIEIALPLPRMKIREVSTGKEHCLALTEMGEVLSWGSGMKGQLGNGEINKIENPEVISSLAGLQIAHICCGGWHSIALSSSGDVYVWGWNDVGQLGFPSKALRSGGVKWDDIYLSTLPERPIQTDLYSQIAAPESMINPDRSTDAVNVQASPKLLDFWKVECPVKRISCGDRHSVFLLENGTAWATGWNLYGQLGIGSNKSADEPTLVPLQSVVGVFAGGWNSIFAVSKGES